MVLLSLVGAKVSMARVPTTGRVLVVFMTVPVQGSAPATV